MLVRSDCLLCLSEEMSGSVVLRGVVGGEMEDGNGLWSEVVKSIL